MDARWLWDRWGSSFQVGKLTAPTPSRQSWKEARTTTGDLKNEIFALRRDGCCDLIRVRRNVFLHGRSSSSHVRKIARFTPSRTVKLCLSFRKKQSPLTRAMLCTYVFRGGLCTTSHVSAPLLQLSFLRFFPEKEQST